MLTFPKTQALLHRPHVITQSAALDYLTRLIAVDHRIARHSQPLELAKRLAQVRRPAAMDDDDIVGEPIREPEHAAAYAPDWLGKPDAELDCGIVLKDGIALLSIDTPLAEEGFGFCGVWYHGYDSIEAMLDVIDGESSIKAGFIRWKTPGGVVAPGLYDLTAKLQGRSRAAKEGAKPLWSYADMACSGGYWLACPTDTIIAPHVGYVGSIGAVYTHVSLAGMDEKAGIKVTPIHFGKFKTAGADFRDLTEEEVGHLQAMIDDLGEDFLEVVAVGRGGKLTSERARATEARVFAASTRDPEHSGLAQGLVDLIQPQRDAFASLVEKVGARSPISIPAKAGSPAARAASPKPAITAGASKETDMKRAAKLAAIDAIQTGKRPDLKTADEQLAAIRKILDETDEEEKEADDPPADEKEKEDAGAKKKAEDDEEKEKEAQAKAGAKPDAATVLAILDLPEAVGREPQARVLAGTPGMTVAQAKSILAAGAVAKPATRLAGMTDPKVTADGGEKLTQEQQDIEIGAALARPKTAAVLPF